MNYTDDLLFEIFQYGQYNYNIDQICILLHGRVDEKSLRRDFSNKKSEVYIRYQQGVMEAALEIDKALHTAAKQGNVQAIDMIRIRNLTNQDG